MGHILRARGLSDSIQVHGRINVVDGEVTIRVGQKEIFPVHRTVH